MYLEFLGLYQLLLQHKPVWDLWGIYGRRVKKQSSRESTNPFCVLLLSTFPSLFSWSSKRDNYLQTCPDTDLKASQLRHPHTGARVERWVTVLWCEDTVTPQSGFPYPGEKLAFQSPSSVQAAGCQLSQFLLLCPVFHVIPNILF